MMHEFFFQLEEPSGSMALISGQDVPQRWIRAQCSCGWRAADDARFTLEENAHWEWQRHRDSVARGEARAEVLTQVRLLTVPRGGILVARDVLADDDYDGGTEVAERWLAELRQVVGHDQWLFIDGDVSVLTPEQAREALADLATLDTEEPSDG